MKMQLNRDFVLVSKYGPSVQFLKGLPTHVPPRVVPEAVALGAESVEQDKELEKATMDELHAEQAKAEERAPKIEAGIRTLLVRNQRGDFTSGGRPNLNILYRETGLQIDATELEPIWNKVKAEVQ